MGFYGIYGDFYGNAIGFNGHILGFYQDLGGFNVFFLERHVECTGILLGFHGNTLGIQWGYNQLWISMDIFFSAIM